MVFNFLAGLIGRLKILGNRVELDDIEVNLEALFQYKKLLFILTMKNKN